jgi:hypothetical protein
MKRVLLLIPVLLAAALAPAPGASARIVELGATAESAEPSCPAANQCLSLVRVTGYQGRAAGGRKNPFYIRRDGYIVAFTVTLGVPTAQDIAGFGDTYGSPAQVQLSVLRKGDTRKTRLEHRLVQKTEPFAVDDYFGSSPTFTLEQPLRVKKGNWIALTVPTWAPALATGLTGSDWWRSSRAKGSCDARNGIYRSFEMQELRGINVFGCTYNTARLLYTATYIPDNRPTTETETP